MTIGENGIGSFIHHRLLSGELNFFFDDKSNLSSTQVNCILKLIKNNAGIISRLESREIFRFDDNPSRRNRFFDCWKEEEKTGYFPIYLLYVFCHCILFSRLTMEQTDATAARNSLPSSTTDRTMELRKSQINLLSSNMDDGGFSLNEVCFFCLSLRCGGFFLR